MIDISQSLFERLDLTSFMTFDQPNTFLPNCMVFKNSGFYKNNFLLDYKTKDNCILQFVRHFVHYIECLYHPPSLLCNSNN